MCRNYRLEHSDNHQMQSGEEFILFMSAIVFTGANMTFEVNENCCQLFYFTPYFRELRCVA
jgi:hypothetical protein